MHYMRMIFYYRYLSGDQLLDIPQKLFLLGIAKRKCDTAGAGPTGPADAVDIGLGDIGQLVIDDVRQLVDIDTPRGDIGGDKDTGMSALEIYECALACVL